MTTITVKFDGDGITKLVGAMTGLQNRVPDAMRRALNHTGAKAFTQVKRALGKQLVTNQAAIIDYGKVRPIRANYSRLEFKIVSTGGVIPLKHFRPLQTKKGVSAAPWGKRRLYPHSFISARLGGHVFWRKGTARLPLKRIGGPNVPKELVKDQSAAAFLAAADQFPARVAHEIAVITNGIVA